MDKKNLLITTILFICIFSAKSNTSDTVHVADFNVTPYSYKNVVTAVQKAIEKCKQTGAKVLSFPKGRYDFRAEQAEKREYFISNTSSEIECPSKIKNIGLLFEDIKDLTLEGNGSLFVFHGKMITWALDNCENIQLQNLTMDFERPGMSEMTFREVATDHVIVDIHPDSWFDIIDGKIQFYGEGWTMNRFHALLSDTINGTSIYSSFNPVNKGKAIRLSPLTVRIEGDFTQTNYKAGHILSIRDPYRDHVGAFVNRSKNIRLSNITMHYMHGLGIVSQFSENLNYRNINIVPSRGRNISAFADGMHFSGCKGEVRIENCHFKGMHDDPVNVHGTYLQIQEIHSPTHVTLRFMHHQTYGFPAFYEKDTASWVTAEAIQSKGVTTIKRARMISAREMEVEVHDPLPKGIGIGDALENLTWTPSLTVRNNRFEGTNTRGLLVTTPRKVIIENNTFYRTGMHGILIATDVNSWFESGAVQDVLIRKNWFIDCGYNQWPNNYSIAIEPENQKIIPKHWVHRNIRIIDNTFEVYSGQTVKAKSVDGLIIENNKIRLSSFELDNKNKQNPNAVFRLENCNQVDIQNNPIDLQQDLPIRIDFSEMKRQSIKTDIKNWK